MIIKRVLLLFLIVFTTACGTKRAVYTKPKPRPRTPVTKVEPKVVEEKKETEVLESSSTTKVYADVVKDYINTYKSIAMEEMKEHGVPASITLAQGILESGAGRGTLVKKANNHFGIKCHNWNGKSVYHDDDKKGECFRKYNHPKSSYQDHSLFLSGRGRYSFLFDLSKDDYKGWSKGLRKAGYATDPKYPQKLISLIERYKLYEFDTTVLGKKTKEPKKKKEIDKPKPVVTHEYTVVKGDTLYSISRKYNLTVEKLKEINDLEDNYIKEGQVLSVEQL